MSFKSLISGKISRINQTKGTNPRTYATIVSEGATFNLETQVALEVNKPCTIEVLSYAENIVKTFNGEHQVQTVLRPALITDVLK